jgi:hypothetical protein
VTTLNTADLIQIRSALDRLLARSAAIEAALARIELTQATLGRPALLALGQSWVGTQVRLIAEEDLSPEHATIYTVNSVFIKESGTDLELELASGMNRVMCTPQEIRRA